MTEVAKKFNKKPSDPAFIMLKKRLKNDILKILVWEEKAKTFTSKFHESKYKSRLMILEAGILMARGLPQLAEESLQKARKIVTHYELTSESIIIHDELQALIGLKQGLATYKLYTNNNLVNFDTIKEEFLAQDYFKKLVMPNLFFVGKELNYKEKSAEATQELKFLSEKNPSVQIKYWYLRSEIYYNHLISDYPTALSSAEQFLQLVQESPVYYSKDNLGGAYMQLAIIHIYLSNYTKAEQYADESTGYFVKGSINQLNAYDVKFSSSLNGRKFDRAWEILKTVHEFKSLKTKTLLAARWTYYEANLLFVQNQFADALAMLQQQSDLMGDRSGWRIGYKILEMMCIIELDHLDWLDYRIETFRKLLGDLKKENIARPKLIFQLLKNFIKTGYDFKQTTEKTKEHLDLLNANEDDFEWDPRGSEVIRFDTWWQKKMHQKVNVRV
ncbi:MAG: hypothetical protein H7X71_02725 [Chitinophagales bacterium]|nr:hypothetical protein [Chitinophagales bacterium]